MPIHNYLACTLYEIGLPVSTDAYVNLNVGPAKNTRRARRKLARLHLMIHIHNQLNYSFQFLLCPINLKLINLRKNINIKKVFKYLPFNS